jgi:hypothetical protein
MASKARRPRVKLEDERPEAHILDETGKRVLAMLTALEDEQDMNEWEQGFVADMMDRFYKREQSLTQGQFDKLEHIYRKWN